MKIGIGRRNSQCVWKAVIYSQSSPLIIFSFSRSQNVFASCWGYFQQHLFNHCRGFQSLTVLVAFSGLHVGRGCLQAPEMQQCWGIRDSCAWHGGNRSHFGFVVCSCTLRQDRALGWGRAWSTLWIHLWAVLLIPSIILTNVIEVLCQPWQACLCSSVHSEFQRFWRVFCSKVSSSQCCCNTSWF